MSLIDCHCHLYALDRIETAILRARDAGVTKAVVVSEDQPSMEQTLRLRDAFPEFVLPGLGIHPVNVFSMSPLEWERAFSFLKSHAHEASCIGEIGLDFKYATTEKEQEKQRKALHAQMEVAADNHLPINLHSRRALRQTMEEAIAFTLVRSFRETSDTNQRGRDFCLGWPLHPFFRGGLESRLYHRPPTDSGRDGHTRTLQRQTRFTSVGGRGG
jgi:Tat protein secretion system quality control protein TatD with DNase activity